jgi:membrane associated rhomboid family serine protease
LMFPSPMQYGQRYSMRVTYSLMAANVVVYVVMQVGGNPLYAALAQTGNAFFGGDYWQVFTAMFVHFDIFHIGFNMIALYYFGRLNEISYSRGEYLAIYFGAGLLGNAVSLFVIPGFVETGGASGAIFGLVGSYAARNRSLGNIALALVYAAFIFIESSGPGVNIYAHLFGIVGGFLLGLFFTRTRAPE